MADPGTVLVVTPSLGGHYFGELLAGLTREVSSAGGRLVVVEHLPVGGVRGEPGEPGDFAAPVGWSLVGGVVSITVAVESTYLQALRDLGKPVVLTGAQMVDFAAPVAMADNHGGVFAAVEHLIGHGHTRIGFVGNLAQGDVRERFGAYVDALETHDLVADPALVFAAPDNGEPGGVAAAHALLECRDRPTALMIATDRNAIGLIDTLTDAGLVMPRDLAVAAFDNIEAGALSIPSLSSVDQRFDEVGSLAGRLVLAQMRGESVPHRVFTSPSASIAVRESCGCISDTHRQDVREDSWLLDASPELLRDKLQDALGGAVLTGDDLADSRLRDAVLATIREAERLLQSGPEVTSASLRSLTEAICRLTSRPDTLRRITNAMTDYAERIGILTAETPDRPTPASTSVAGALWKLQARGFLRQTEATEAAIQEQFVVDAGLLAAAGRDASDLTWLTGTHVRAGVLALWVGGPSSGRLRIVGTYDPDSHLPDLVGVTVSTGTFPPMSLIGACAPASQEVCVVVPVRTSERDWGLLAVVADIDTTSARETYQHWAALLCTSLESEELHREVRRTALYDALTGLPNRRLFLDRLERAVALRRRPGTETPFAVLFLDLDGFKLINDSFGHPMGDRVLAAVGARIKRELREVDTGARFGGDEFAILLHDSDPGGAMLVAQRVQAALAEVLDLDGHEFTIRASLGIATSAFVYTCAEDVLRDADAAMYRAKALEPGTVALFDAAMHAQAVSRQKLNAEIRRALKGNEFEVYYQPIVNLETGRTDRFEALVRWRHPERGLVMPGEFLPVMEETGLIVRLGHWVIDVVCRDLADWGPAVANVAINISDREFWHREVLATVLDALRRHHLTPDRLTLEITESVLMRRPKVALRMMREFHDAGLRLHIDDFGRSSSIETLHQFPVDAFKIDRSLMGSLASGDNSDNLITSLVSLGRALGMAVVAEGVESGEQLAFLQGIGCATGQGFLFMPAVSHDEATHLLGHDLGAGPLVVGSAPDHP